ncbi:MAG TPA: hypothetical protein VLK25_06855 [Allosphingosinicella sp.]|nr:hypothetical protein [Allosphingosinicella sp.]
MKTPILAACLTLAVGAAAEARLMPLPGPGAAQRATPAPADCPLIVGFGSYAMGIDQAAYTRIDRLLRADRGVRAVSRHAWGREGEVTLCARTRSRADAQRLFAAIRTRLPVNPRGPVTIELLGGRRYTTPPPRRR